MPPRRGLLIEPLEGRVLLALFANGIDSDNMGEGIWAWQLHKTMWRLDTAGIGNFWSSSSGGTYFYDTFFNYIKNTHGVSHIITKAAEGATIFTDRGPQVLRGVPEEWRLFAVR